MKKLLIIALAILFLPIVIFFVCSGVVFSYHQLIKFYEFFGLTDFATLSAGFTLFFLSSVLVHSLLDFILNLFPDKKV